MSNETKAKKGDSIIRDTLALFAITLVAGLLLGAVYKVTKSPIEQANLEAKKKSYSQVMSEAKDFSEDSDLTAKLKAYKGEGCELNEIVVAKNDGGEAIGYAVLVTSKEGYGGDIKFSLGVDMEGKITGLEILSMSETAGLGARCTEDEFKGQYKGKAGEVNLVKGDAAADNDVSAISGATITSTAVTKAVNNVLAFLSSVKG